jgi:hypothetical protein
MSATTVAISAMIADATSKPTLKDALTSLVNGFAGLVAAAHARAMAMGASQEELAPFADLGGAMQAAIPDMLAALTVGGPVKPPVPTKPEEPITQAEYDAYRKANNQALRLVSLIEPVEIAAIRKAHLNG